MGFLILVTAFLTIGCSALPQTQYVHEEPPPLEFPDGSVADVGDKVYMDKDGNATAAPIDPITNQPNKPFMVTDVKKLESLKQSGEKAASGLPAPFGWLASLGILVVGAGGIAAARKLNSRKLEQAGARKKKTS